MLRNILYIAGPEKLVETKANLSRLGKVHDISEQFEGVELLNVEHKSLAPLKLNVYTTGFDNPISLFLNKIDIDLLILDERGEAPDVISSLDKIKTEIAKLTKLWGPDFNFPLKRCVAILKDTPDAAHRAFVLGRDHVKDVIVDPHSIVKVLKKISNILAADIHENLDRKIGMALSGGALEGFLYQIGACYALDKVIKERSVNSFDIYSGVSSGSIIGSLLACDVDLKEIILSIKGQSKTLPKLSGKTIFDFAAKDVTTRILKNTSKWTGLDPGKMMTNFLRSVPTGFFKGDALKEYFETCLKTLGSSNYFHNLRPELYIGATDQDTLEHIIFHKGMELQPTISEAVKASCALPPFFTPQKIGSRRYIDGQVTRTSNLHKVIEDGCRLVFIIDPLKPFASEVPGAVDKEGGVFALIQTVKALVYSRFASTLSHMTERFPDVDFIVLQPDEETTRKMAGSPMRYKVRTEIIELAFNTTVKKLLSRYEVYKTKLEKHDLFLIDKTELEEIARKGIDI